jgi:hypothetical protein
MTRRPQLYGAAAFALLFLGAPVHARGPETPNQGETTAHEATAPEQAPNPQPQTSQPRGDKTRDRMGRADDPAAHIPELRDETFRLMDAYLISNLQESLGLTDEQFAKALPLVKKLQSDRRDFAKRRMQALRLLRKTLVSGSATEVSVGELLRDLKSASADERAGTLRNLDVLDAVLTPIQQAKYRVFEAEVDLRLRHLLARSQDRDRSKSR